MEVVSRNFFRQVETFDFNKKNVKSYLHYSVEGLENEDSYDLSLKEVLSSIEFVAEKPILDFTVFKPTAIASTQILKKISLS